MITVLGIGLLLLLPQLSGLLVTRLARRSSWAAWPAAAIAVFGVAFYWWLWVPARASERHCGNWSLALGFLLLLGLFLHLGVGVLFGLLARRPRGATRQQMI
jgi:predicted Na+-dependent transporter